MLHWTKVPPRRFDIVTGFFPEVKPKHNWETNPRPILVTGVFRNPEDGMYAVRMAYGTGEVDKAQGHKLRIGNLTELNRLHLPKPTAFVIGPGSKMVIRPWTEEFFQPWGKYSTPIISRLSDEMADYVLDYISKLPDLPMP